MIILPSSMSNRMLQLADAESVSLTPNPTLVPLTKDADLATTLERPMSILTFISVWVNVEVSTVNDVSLPSIMTRRVRMVLLSESSM